MERRRLPVPTLTILVPSGVSQPPHLTSKTQEKTDEACERPSCQAQPRVWTLALVPSKKGALHRKKKNRSSKKDHTEDTMLIEDFRVESPQVQYGEDHITSEYKYDGTECDIVDGRMVLKPIQTTYQFRTQRKVPKLG